MTNGARRTRFKLYVFDFDGVLFDSAAECFELAVRAINRPAWKGVIGPTASSWLNEQPAEARERFLISRHHVGPPWQYGLLLQLIAEDRVPSTVADFLRMADAQKAVWQNFTGDYFAERAVLSSNVDCWKRLFRSHEAAISLFRAVHQAGIAHILSTRDSASIRRLFRVICGLELDGRSLLARAGEKQKWELLSELAKQGEVSPQEVFFLDDYLPHLLPAKKAGFSVFLASWGYLSPDDHQTAARENLPVLQLHQLVRLAEGVS